MSRHRLILIGVLSIATTKLVAAQNCNPLNEGLVVGCPKVVLQRYCPSEQSSHSIVGIQSTHLNFINHSGKTVRTYWINYQGARQFYAEIADGQSYLQQTYVSHPWVVTDTQNNCIAFFMPGPVQSSAVIR